MIFLSGLKEDNFVQSFIEELSNYFEKLDNKLFDNNIKNNNLKQENCIYQVVEMGTDGAYLQNTSNNKISKETDISKEVLNKIGNDSVLIYKNGKYIAEEELTRQIFR